jgi:3'-phosphoadenosine 5'-phosphosulfate sulfotransferase (PAPS reductase)/FAD synthetase
MTTTMDLRAYDLILVNTSGGKDSSVAAWVVAKLAEEQGVKDRIVLVHATFPEEWEGTVELVKAQAAQLGLPVEVCERGEGLLDYVRRRKMWPSNKARYCTSDFKRAPIDKVITRLAPGKEDRVKVLNVMGIRSEESPARAKKEEFRPDERRTNTRREVDEWLPIFDMKLAEVWKIITDNNIPVHPAYKQGMPRLSCRFCIFAPKAALVLAGKLNPELLREYVKVEAEIGHSFRDGFKIAEVLAEVEKGAPAEAVADWKM